MSSDKDRFRIWMYALCLGALAVVYRVAARFAPVPEGLVTEPGQISLWNLMPIGALALFVRSRLRTRFAFGLPLGVMFLADLVLVPILNRQGWPSFYVGTPVVYASFLVYVLLGRLASEREWSPMVLGGLALL